MSRAIASVQREAGNPGQVPHPVRSLPPFSGPWGLAAPKKVFLHCAEGRLLRDGLLGPPESSNNYRAQCRSSQAAWNQAQAQGQPSCPHVFKARVLMSQPHRLLPPPAISAFYSARRDTECRTDQETGQSPTLGHVLCSLAHCLLAQQAILED